jgi:glutamate-1-semialdehyde 2,1-aminomutase
LPSSNIEKFAVEFADSREWSERANNVIAGGVCHDSWLLSPFPITFERASGPYKFDVQNRRFIDLWMGHGSLILGHCYPPVIETVKAQLDNSSHISGLLKPQVELAKQICDLVPSCERVRFTSSGTEATLLAIRVGRAFTKKQRIVLIAGHYHGWHDYVVSSLSNCLESGIDSNVSRNVTIVDPFDLEQVAIELERMDVALVMLEPGGGGSSILPANANFLRGLREITSKYGALLVFDEMITGFRACTGGVQKVFDVIPDLTVLGKVLFGGFPGGALGGQKEVMSVFRSNGSESQSAQVLHAGTFNGNPISLVAGSATLREIRDQDVLSSVNKNTLRLCRRLNEVAMNIGIDIQLFSQCSTFHYLLGGISRGVKGEPSVEALLLMREFLQDYSELRRVFLMHGIDSHPTHGWLAFQHRDAVIDDLEQCFLRAMNTLKSTQGWQHVL